MKVTLWVCTVIIVFTTKKVGREVARFVLCLSVLILTSQGP